MIQAVPKSAAIGLVALAQLAIFAFIGFISYERTLAEEKAHLALEARASAEQIAQAMRQVEIELEHLVRQVERHGLRMDEYNNAAHQSLVGVTTSAPYVGGAGFVDAGGTAKNLVIANPQKVVSGLQVADRSYFKIHRDHAAAGTYLSEPILSRVGNRWIFVASRRLSAPDGTFLGVAVVSINPNYFAETFALSHETPVQRQIITKDGAVVATANHLLRDPLEQSSDQVPGRLSRVPAEQVSKEGFFWSSPVGGGDVLTAVAPVPGWPLVATASMSSGDVFADLWTDLVGLGLVLIASLGALTALLLNFYRHQEKDNELQRRFRGLIEDASDGVVIHDTGLVLFANDATAQMWGLHHGTELRGRSLIDFIPEELHNQTRAEWRKIKESGQPSTQRRTPGRRVDDETIFVDIASQRIDWGNKLAIRSSLIEVTEQVRLAKRDQRRTAILSAVNDAHSIYLNQTRNRDSFEKLLEKILDLSGSAYGLIAEKLEDEEGRPYLLSLAISDISWDDETRRWYDSVSRGGMEFRNIDNLRGVPLREGKTLIANNPKSHPASTGVPCGHLAMDNVMILPLAQDYEILGEVALANREGGYDEALAEELGPIVQAITRIVSDYRSTRLREAAEQASRSKSAFLAHMSHELRTPLSGVIANLELLGDTPLEHEQSELVDASMSAGRALLGVIGNTLDFSKIEADELVLDMVEFDPGAMIENIQSIFLAAAKDKGVDLYTVVDTNVPQIVVADEMRLRQVFANLVGNAIKFTGNGRIGIYLSAEKTGKSQARLRFSVDDTGTGFDPEKAADLFKPFGQEKDSTSRSFGGTGLGLTIAQRLLELHEGEISCYAQPGEGSSFVASLPVEVVEWSIDAVQDLNGDRIVLLFPTGDFPDDLANGLTAAGAEVLQTTDPAAIADVNQASDGRQMTLVIDWDSAQFGMNAFLRQHGKTFDQILVAASRYDPDRRRAALFFKDLDLVTKPLTASNLSHAIRGEERVTPPAAVVQNISAPVESRLFEDGEAPRILVAEDQPMNQMVLRRQLRRMGIDCDIAEHGQEALEFMERSSYDMVITDCSMPIMDGFDLSRAIRERESGGGKPCAIIALTANAVSGDAQRCYDAGMNAYLSKPASLSELSATIQKWWKASEKDLEEAPSEAEECALPEEAAQEPSSEAAPPINREALAELLGEDDPETLDALISDFFRSWQTSFAALEEPLENKDTTALREAAHAAKGTARYGMANSLADTCETLEKLAGSGELDGAEDLIKSLETETDRLKSYLEDAGLICDEERQSA